MKLIGYTRVSTQEQGQEGHSLDEQDTQIRAYAKLHPDTELVDVVSEIGSAKDMKRPGLLRLFHRMQEEGIQGIVVVDLDRLTRNLSNLIHIVEDHLRPEKGPERNLISISEQIDLASPIGRMMLYLIGLIANWERERTSEHSKRTVAHLKSQGKRFNAHPNTGLMVDPEDSSRLIPCPKEQEILTKIKIMRGMGTTLNDISKFLAIEGLLNRAGKPFTESAISKLCRRHGYGLTEQPEEVTMP